MFHEYMDRDIDVCHRHLLWYIATLNVGSSRHIGLIYSNIFCIPVPPNIEIIKNIVIVKIQNILKRLSFLFCSTKTGTITNIEINIEFTNAFSIKGDFIVSKNWIKNPNIVTSSFIYRKGKHCEKNTMILPRIWTLEKKC